MANPPNIKRIVKEDFPKENQELIDRLSFSMNPFMEEVSSALTKGLNIDNFAQEIKEITTFTDLTVGTGYSKPKQTLQFNTNLTQKIKGIMCIRAQNLTDPNVPVNSLPCINFIPQGQIITITHVTGLPALTGDPNTSQTFKLTLLVIT